jgi:hypothetical protein
MRQCGQVQRGESSGRGIRSQQGRRRGKDVMTEYKGEKAMFRSSRFGCEGRTGEVGIRVPIGKDHGRFSGHHSRGSACLEGRWIKR